MKLQLRPRAELDLERIYDEGCLRWGEMAADNYLLDLGERLDKLVEYPQLGSDQSHILPGLRKWSVGAHHAFYRVDDDRLVVIRILHPKMDVDSALP